MLNSSQIMGRGEGGIFNRKLNRKLTERSVSINSEYVVQSVMQHSLSMHTTQYQYTQHSMSIPTTQNEVHTTLHSMSLHTAYKLSVHTRYHNDSVHNAKQTNK